MRRLLATLMLLALLAIPASAQKVTGGGGGSATPTGTGFVHVTSGAQDAASVSETGTGSVVRATGATLASATVTALTVGECSGCDVGDNRWYSAWQVPASGVTSIQAFGGGSAATSGTASAGTAGNDGFWISYASGTTANSLASGSGGVYMNNTYVAATDIDFSARVKDIVPTETNYRTWVGLSQNGSTQVGADAPSTDYAAFFYNPATHVNGNWRFCTRQSPGSQACVDTGVAYNSTVKRMRIVLSSSGTSVKAYLNGSLITTVAWTSTQTLAPQITKTTTDAVAKNIQFSMFTIRLNQIY